MRSTGPLCFGLVLLLPGAVGAQSKPQDAILGKWVMTQKEGGAEITLLLDFDCERRKLRGALILTTGNQTRSETIEGTYRLLDDRTLEVTIKNGGREEASRIAIKSVTDRELILADGAAGREMRFLRPTK
jgi:uncharacterized protein (TIGR03066 family)